MLGRITKAVTNTGRALFQMFKVMEDSELESLFTRMISEKNMTAKAGGAH